MTGGLFDPLGTGHAPARRRRPSAPAVALGAAVLLLAALFAAAALRDDGTRGRPVAVAPIAHVAAPPRPEPPPAAPAPSSPAVPPSSAEPASPPAPAAAGLPAAPEGADVEIQNGVRIVRPRRQVPAPAAAPAAGR